MGRTVEELMDVPDPAWPVIVALLTESVPPPVVLPGGNDAGRREIAALQVSARSYLGALAFHTGGILLDGGWLRILGCGHERCRLNIVSASALLGWAGDAPPVGVVVGVDVLGGVFAINGGFLGSASPGDVAYFGPDDLGWSSLAISYSAWVHAMLDAERRRAFYADLRWAGWEQEIAAAPDNHGFSVVPFLWTTESRPIEKTSRRPVPLEELVTLHQDIARQMGS
ncbi:MAG: hypothetical protein AMXMBFR47_41690 [Planctomycetota bacterium]